MLTDFLKVLSPDDSTINVDWRDN